MADEDLGEVSSAQPKYMAQRRSNWLLDAIMAGAGASTVVGPIGGLAVGIGRGIMSRRLDKNALDQMNEERDSIAAANRDVDTQLKRMGELPGITDIDKEQLNTLQTNRQILARMMNSSDPNVRAQANQRYLSLMGDANSWLDDIEQRQDTQQDAIRTTYADAFKDLRDRFRNTQDGVSESKRSSTELLDFIDGMSQDEMNLPFNRQRIAALVDSSARAFNIDTPDKLDAVGTALGGVSSGAVAGPWGALLGGAVAGGKGILQAIKSGDFVLKPAQVRHLALTNIRSLDQTAQEKMTRYSDEAKALAGTGQRFGIVADNDSIFGYVTGQREESPILPAARRADPSLSNTRPRLESSRPLASQPASRGPGGPSASEQALLDSGNSLLGTDAANLARAPDAQSVLQALKTSRRTRPTND